MKTIIKVTAVIGVALFFSGCCSSSMEVLQNGYSYYGNSCSCAKSNLLADGVTLRCYDKNGNFTGNLRPLHQNQVQNIRYNQARADAQQAEQRRQSAARSAQTNQMRQDMLNSSSYYSKPNKGYKTYDAYGNLRNSNDCYTAKDAYGRYVKTCK